jgi:(p)ppGpp synthase/HD superfamily hydrolase
MNAELVERAARFAKAAHEGQTRKYTGEPYFNHPARVVEILATIGVPHEVAAAAYLHDVLEDVGTDVLIPLAFNERFAPETVSHAPDILWVLFWEQVTQLVVEVTDVSKPTDGKRAVRKEIDRQHLAKASPQAKTIKLADLIDNSRDIVKHDPEFARTYMKEKAFLLEVLKEGDATLYAEAERLIEEYFNAV